MKLRKIAIAVFTVLSISTSPSAFAQLWGGPIFGVNQSDPWVCMRKSLEGLYMNPATGEQRAICVTESSVTPLSEMNPEALENRMSPLYNADRAALIAEGFTVPLFDGLQESGFQTFFRYGPNGPAVAALCIVNPASPWSCTLGGYQGMP